MILSPGHLALSASFQLSYCEGGPKTAPSVVFIPGYSDTWRTFQPVIASLPPEWRAIAISQRGHGDSSRPYAGYSPRDFAQDLLAVLDRLEIERAVIVGHCLGGVVARRFAMDYPERLWSTAVAEMRDPVDPAFVAEFQRSTIAQFVPEPFFESVVEESLKMPARVWKATLAALRSADLSGELRGPCWLAWGDRDTVVSREEQENLQRAIPQARFTAYEGAGHCPHWEAPHRFAGDLAMFLTETS
jgi:pimeloyl-ACP methyl ester carboxylesterase